MALGAGFGTLWFASLAATPYLLAKAIDNGLSAHDTAVLVAWSAGVLALGAGSAVLGIMRHRSMTKLRTHAGLMTADLVLEHATRLGAALPRRLTAGEVVTIGISDVWVVGRAMNVLGVGVAGTISYATIAVLLFRTSPLLAVVVLAGVPVLGVVVGPLLTRMQAAGQRYRERQGVLAGRLVDVLGGLGVLNGLGGKETHLARYRAESAGLRDQGYRVDVTASWVGALGTGLPVIFLAVVTWISARMAAAGEITIGELVAVYGWTAILAIPVDVMIFCGMDVTRGLVAARRVVGFLRVPVEPVDGEPAPEGPGPLRDPVSGVTAEPGRFTALAVARTAEAEAVLDRLGRYGATDATWSDRRLDRIAQPEIRDRVMVATHDADLFAGTLREVVAGREEPDDDRVRRAIDAAVAHDVAADLERPVEWRGRNLSGGQRQRLRLARALHADPEMLLAAEPTSAVDAHTEAAIAQRLTDIRSGRGTVLATTSPVLLARADVVHYLVGGRVAASGTHQHLLETEQGYRELVTRVFDEASA
ncbi:ABC transporter ATP-binding protein [Actinoplanes sp. NBRC 103695]|uniref:ABC transporter transmembrane domain-containing protein n=1 Tax=Actinoplanes sp. NBRC 103695 TaxID=3032202 RepID=UPI0024A1A2C8|nr:ABC transporter ATP-binding protein [Actinoplanes sp. NBRC 103695]GLZ02228.1 ABC transporter [Actinoplanes sp. NBRC 103695]